jgi:hypothetical protein
MGLEKVVLNKIEEVDAEIADNSYFAYGTLFIRGGAKEQGLKLFRVTNAIKDAVTCELITSEVGDDLAIDFA